MRIVSGVFCIMMVLFTLVQFNDPDALHWAFIYGVAALWCGVAAYRPELVSGVQINRLLMICIALAAIATVWYFPKTPKFWQTEVWWVTETAREGMGMMIALIALIVTWFTQRKYSVG